MWNKIRSSPCYGGAGIEQRNWANLFAAISQRDAPDIVRFASELLAPQIANSGSDLAYLTTIAAAADVQMGQMAQAHNLLKEQLKRFDHSGPYWFPLLNLVAMTQPSGANAPAHNQ